MGELGGSKSCSVEVDGNIEVWRDQEGKEKGDDAREENGNESQDVHVDDAATTLRKARKDSHAEEEEESDSGQDSLFGASGQDSLFDSDEELQHLGGGGTGQASECRQAVDIEPDPSDIAQRRVYAHQVPGLHLLHDILTSHQASSLLQDIAEQDYFSPNQADRAGRNQVMLFGRGGAEFLSGPDEAPQQQQGSSTSAHLDAEDVQRERQTCSGIPRWAQSLLKVLQEKCEHALPKETCAVLFDPVKCGETFDSDGTSKGVREGQDTHHCQAVSDGPVIVEKVGAALETRGQKRNAEQHTPADEEKMLDTTDELEFGSLHRHHRKFKSSALDHTSTLVASNKDASSDSLGPSAPLSPSRPSNQASTLTMSCKSAYRRARQLILNLYEPGAGIASHIDLAHRFDDGIFCLSLGSGVVMTFARSDLQPVQTATGTRERKNKSKSRPDFKSRIMHESKAESKAKSESESESESESDRLSIWLPPRSLLILTGKARWQYLHGIEARPGDWVSDQALLLVHT
ncbi:hypothetical protein CBOM_04870 [Ceraceosorus bombacis]|uniref:Alpha-ketoglutarate-dependent dioxygenase AlkB-like domain-containing protein n=1 Tax=Ceraceosorus bombacis TaxID=401625 RepID=A0A0P1BRM5_9BASI|nr:hypothetical protein CBOM_04870 [Ceraceosorus bombacis]